MTTGLLGWKYNPRSSLMFVPPGLPAPPSSTAALPLKTIVHENTRLQLETTDSTRRKRHEHYGQGDDTGVHGYIHTPSPTPDDVAPPVTWGGVMATPRVLSGPMYRMQEPDKKDEVAASLTRRATASIMRKRAGETPMPAPNATPMIGVPSAAATVRVSKLTPAAMNLLARQQLRTPAADPNTALRTTYGATPSRPVFAAGATPRRQ